MCRAKNRTMGMVIWVLMAFLCALCLVPLGADETGKVAQEIMKQYQDAVISVELTIEQGMSMMGMRKSESKSEVTGTVIDPFGLTVLSLFSTDPAEVLNLMMSSEMFGMGDTSQFKWESTVKDVKMIMPDGKEVPAQIVLRDKDLDLAFIRPLEKLAKPATALDLSKSMAPSVLDELVVLNRLGKVASRVPAVSISRVQAIVTKPRTFFVPATAAMSEGLGVPVFSLDGKVVGILLLRVMRGAGASMGSLLGGTSGMGMLPVVLPAEDIIEVAKQAPEAKKEEKAEEEKSPEKQTEKTEGQEPSPAPQ